MKTFKLFLFLLLILSSNSFAQNYYGRNPMSRGPMHTTQPKKPSAEDIQEYRDEQIDNYMTKLKEEVKLDDLQFIAIKNEIVANNKSIDIVLKKEDSQEAKNNEVIALRTKTEKTILSYLNKDQKEKYETFKLNFNKKKDKKGKKKKDDDLEVIDSVKQ